MEPIAKKRTRRVPAVLGLALLFVVAGGVAAYAATVYSTVGITAVIQGQKFENRATLTVPGLSHAYSAQAQVTPRTYAVAAGNVGVRARAYFSDGTLIYQSSAWYNSSSVPAGSWFTFGSGTDPAPFSSVYSKGTSYIWNGSAWVSYTTFATIALVTQ